MIAETGSASNKNPLLIMGADINDTLNPVNTYEAFVPPARGPNPQGLFQTTPRLALGPTPPSQIPNLGLYPRCHLLANGELFMSGMNARSSQLRHDLAPGVWMDRAIANNGVVDRFYGGSVMFPNISGNYANTVFICGGASQPSPHPHQFLPAMDSAQLCKAGTAVAGCWPNGSGWTDFDDSYEGVFPVCGNALPRMHVKRNNVLMVLLPDASILAVGGDNATGWAIPLERFKSGQWHLLANLTSTRAWHATAVLLPSGKVLIGGGDLRTYDYEIYVPPYLSCGLPRPVITSVNGGIEQITYGQEFTVQYTLAGGAEVQRIVLMRPGAVTHSTDLDQRYVQLAPGSMETAPGQISVMAPAVAPGFTSDPNVNAALPGFYMLFALSDAGVPSEAAWVELRR